MSLRSRSPEGCGRARIALVHGLPALLLCLLMPTCAMAGGEKTAGTPFQHKTFSIVQPPGWKAVTNPEPGVEIGFVDGKTPGGKWHLHYELMPDYAEEPPSAAATLSAMASQFDTLVRQNFPGARKVASPSRKLPGKTLVHATYEFNEDGTPVAREYMYLIVYHTAYVIQSTVPKARKAEAGACADMLFRTFVPRPGAAPTPRTADQALNNLRSNLPTLAASMPPGWRATIKEVKFLNDSPKKGNRSLLIVASWPRWELKKEFASARDALAALGRGKPPSASVPQSTADLVYYVGQLLGLASGEVYSLKPPVTHLAVQMLDPAGNKVGIARIGAQDLIRIISGDVKGGAEAARSYQFESP